jgi:hypothetical protein
MAPGPPRQAVMRYNVGQFITPALCRLLFFLILVSCHPEAEKKLEPTFSSISELIFIPKCALYTCHSPAYYQESGNIDFSTKDVYDSLVNVRSNLFPDEFRIKPGDPDNSNLIKRLEGTILAGVPLERSSISQKEINVIRQWIKEGADNN